jgi:hypothetical protein
VPKENVLTMNPENPTFVPWEEAKVGNMNDAFEVEFSDDASWESDLAITFYNNYNSSVFTRLNLSELDASHLPVKITGYGRTITDDGIELIIIREAVKNADGTIGHWNFVFEKEKFDENLWWSYGESLQNGKDCLIPLIGKGEGPADSNYTTKKLRRLTNKLFPDALQYYQEFINTQTVPKEMEAHLMIGKPESWSE